MAEGDDKTKWWKNRDKLEPGIIGAGLAVAACAAGLFIKKKIDEKDDK
jgi:hypothetical protein|tara:strand:- start:4994 stop:5137 length:144 start_codon:yes stop_codon:yes gene_type:complete